MVLTGEGVKPELLGTYRPVAPHGDGVHYESEHGKHLYSTCDVEKPELRQQWYISNSFTPTKAQATAYLRNEKLEPGTNDWLCEQAVRLPGDGDKSFEKRKLTVTLARCALLTQKTSAA